MYLSVSHREGESELFWPNRNAGTGPSSGSSGCPVFLKQNDQFAGLLRIVEIGANQGKNPLREAVIVPASVVRRHVARVIFDRAVRGFGADPIHFANTRKHVCALDLAGIPKAVEEIIFEMRGSRCRVALWMGLIHSRCRRGSAVGRNRLIKNANLQAVGTGHPERGAWS